MENPKFKAGDVVVNQTNSVYQVIKEFRNDKLGKQILCRKYRSQDRVAFMPWQIVKHPFFSK
jgi:hypothetical protein|tara:strand:- start:2532 stop:2717 length:186 start_codon:yes stop_codon:yes gene_type:complete